VPFFWNLKFRYLFCGERKIEGERVLFSLPSWSSCFRARFYSPSLWKMKGETKRARVRAQSFEGGKRKEKKTIDPREKTQWWRKNFLLAVIQSREGEDSLWWWLVLLSKTKFLCRSVPLPWAIFALATVDRCCFLATTWETTLAPAIWDCKANIVSVCVCYKLR